MFTKNALKRCAALARCSTALALCVPGYAHGQGLEEIIVTARKKSESLIRVPVSVAAFSSADILRTAATDLGTIARLAPQVSIAQSGTGSGASISIRGIGSSPLDAGIEQSVSINFDGVQISRGRVAAQAMFDIEQVEILKGPQALFFGKNSPAGVISITSAGPTKTLEASARVGYEFEARERFIETTLSGPLSDTFGARLAIRASEMDGWLKNIAAPMANPWAPAFPLPGAPSGRQPNNKDIAARLTLRYEPTSQFSAQLKAMIGRHKDNDLGGIIQSVCGGPATQTTSYGIPDPFDKCKLDTTRSSTSIPPGLLVDWPNMNSTGTYSKIKTGYVGLTLNYEFNNLTLSSVSGYYELDQRGALNAAYNAIGNVFSANVEDSKNYTQEVRLVSDFSGPINFSLGGYYEKMRRYTHASAMIRYVGADPATGRYFSYARDANNSGNTYSVFGQLRVNATDEIELSGGVRWTRETKKLSIGNPYVHPAFVAAFSPQGAVINKSYSDDDLSPEATITYRPNRNTTIYAAYKRGYKSGGFANPGALTRNYFVNQSLLEFKSETAEGFEAGVKLRLLDNRLRAEATAYRYNFNGLQLSSFDPVAFAFVTRNAASVRTTGADISLTYAATDDLTLTAASGYNHAKFTSFPNAPCDNILSSSPGGCTSQDFTGRQMFRAPKWVHTASGDFKHELTSSTMLGLNADVSYTSSYFTQENLNPVGYQKGFFRVGAGARVFSSNKRWELALIGRNLFNKVYITQSFDKTAGAPGVIAAVIDRPRQILLQGTVRY